MIGGVATVPRLSRGVSLWRRSAMAALRVAFAACAGFALFNPDAPSAAQAYPTKPIRWIVPFPPGGPTDVVARIVGQRLAEQLGQPVLIENRPGAAGNLGTELVAKGPSDGTMILMVVPGLVTNPYFMRNSVDPETLQPVIQLTRGAFVLLASPRFAAGTVAEVLAAIKAKPGGVSCGASGALPTVGCALLQAHAGADVLLVQYKGNAPALNALMSGEIDLLFDVPNTALPQVKAGRVRALASAAAGRAHEPFDRLPTLAETMPDFDLVSWQGIMVARNTEQAIVRRLNDEVATVLASADVRARLFDSGLTAVGGSPEAFGETVHQDAVRYGRILTQAGVRPE